jgi:hypothetical protein
MFQGQEGRDVERHLACGVRFVSWKLALKGHKSPQQGKEERAHPMDQQPQWQSWEPPSSSLSTWAVAGQ